MEKITEIAINRKMYGGGKREGTAIPVSEIAERVYFNTSASKEEVDAVLSQLPYVQTDLFAVPIYIAYLEVTSWNPSFMFGILIAQHEEGYDIRAMRGNINDPGGVGESIVYNAVAGWGANIADGGFDISGHISSVLCNDTECDYAPSDYNGLPIGAQNELINGVLSITPF